jgi:hypothetical protein
VTPGSQLVLFSDGLVEAENAAGDVFGEERLAGLLGRAPPGARLDRVKEGVAVHLAGETAHDDMSLVLVQFNESGKPQVERPVSGPHTVMRHAGAWRIALRLGASELRGMDVVPALLATLQNFESARAHGGALFIVLSELYNNALDHGVLGLSSALKHSDGGMERYLEQRTRKLQGLAAGRIEIEIEHRDEGGAECLRIVCRDSGPGFDYKNVGADDGSGPRAAFGRGLTLVRSLCDSLEFAGSGNEAIARFPLNRA